MMIMVYQAQSSIDEKIAQDILAIEEITGHILAEILQGGVGEIYCEC